MEFVKKFDEFSKKLDESWLQRKRKYEGEAEKKKMKKQEEEEAGVVIRRIRRKAGKFKLVWV